LGLAFDLLCTLAGLAGHFVRGALGGLLYLMPCALGRLLHPMASFLGGGLDRSSGVLGGIFSFVCGGFRRSTRRILHSSSLPRYFAVVTNGRRWSVASKVWL
jgi:hypothetical protein